MKISMKREQNSACIGSAEREKFGAKLKTKNIFKALALAMLMPAMLLTTACSNDDDVVNNAANTENTINKGYALPVTVNVTRQDDGATRASFDGSKLNFSAGDKLFVQGNHENAGLFAGTLDYDAVSGKFSGTIYTQYSYSGTAVALFEGGNVSARLLPAGYETPGYLSINNSGTFNASISCDASKAFATTKAIAVEQFSYEMSSTYSSGFALSPWNAILNFTITGLAASTEVTASFTDGSNVISGNVTTDGSGNATFAIGVAGGTTNLQNCSLTVGGNAITLTSSNKYLTEGKIYNITRAAAPAPSYTMAAAATTSDKGKLICTAGHIHVYNADAECTAGRVAKIIYVGATGNVTYSHGLALAMSDAANGKWGPNDYVHDYKTNNSGAFSSTIEDGLQYNASHNNDSYPAFMNAIANNGTAVPTDCSGWFLPTGYQWQLMINAAGGFAALRDGFNSVGGTNMKSDDYWSSTEWNGNNMYAWAFSNYWNEFRGFGKDSWLNVRSALAF